MMNVMNRGRRPLELLISTLRRQLYDRIMNRLADGYGYRLGQNAIGELAAPTTNTP